MLGPHFYFDLIRLARKPRNHVLRCGYLFALLVGWWYVYEASQPLGGSLNDYARLARNFSFSLLALQYALIMLVTPIYLAGTIVEERESRTLELLYQTQLEDREILLGKFAARVVHLMFFVLMSLPMLAIVSLWGGISVEFLLLHFGLSLLLILLLGSMSLWVSVVAYRYTEAMILAYALEFTMSYLGMPLATCAAGAGGVRLLGQSLWWLIPLAAVPMLGGTYVFYALALWQFRKLRNMAWLKKREPPPPRPKPQPKRERPRRQRTSPTRTIPDHALLWKETDANRHAIDFPDNLVWIGLACMGVIAVLYAFAQVSPVERATGDIGIALRMFAAMGYVSLGGLVYLALAFQAPGAISREREMNTLDFLLLLPTERREILFIKWIAPWIRQRSLIFALLAVPLIGMVTTLFPARTAFAMLLLPWPPLLFVNALGLYLTVVCRRTVTANVVLIAILGAIFAAHLLAWESVSVPLAESYLDLLVPDPRRVHAHWPVLAHQTLMLLAAIAFLRIAFWRFGRDGAGVRS